MSKNRRILLDLDSAPGEDHPLASPLGPPPLNVLPAKKRLENLSRLRIFGHQPIAGRCIDQEGLVFSSQYPSEGFHSRVLGQRDSLGSDLRHQSLDSVWFRRPRRRAEPFAWKLESFVFYLAVQVVKAYVVARDHRHSRDR